MNQSQQIGPYTLQSSLGQGGMADVYLAWDRANRWPAALKVLRGSGKDGRLQKRFEREAAALMKLRHPHIVQIYGAGRTTDGRPYIAMEYIGGGDLEALIARTAGGRLPIHQAVYLMRRVAGAVAYAHEQGIVHRDLKPSNILLRADTGEPVVADLGIASLAGAKPLTGTMESLGTPQYMAPEQASSGATVDARADVYAIGVMLHELLTGRTPFEPDTGWALLARKQQETAPSVLSFRRDLNPQLAAVVDACLMRDPAARYQSAGLLAAALDAFLPADAGPPPPLKRKGAAAKGPVTPTRTPSNPPPPLLPSRQPLGDRSRLVGDRQARLLWAGGAALALLLLAIFLVPLLGRSAENATLPPAATESGADGIVEVIDTAGEMDEPAPVQTEPTSTAAAVVEQPGDTLLADLSATTAPTATRRPTNNDPTARAERDMVTRSGPASSYPIFGGGLARNQVVTVLGRDESGFWVQVETLSGPAWVPASLLDEETGSLESVPVIDIAPPPTSTTTPEPTADLAGDPGTFQSISLIQPRPAACPPDASAPAYPAGDTITFEWSWASAMPVGSYMEVRAGTVGNMRSQGRVDPAVHRDGEHWIVPVSGSTIFQQGDGAYQWAVYLIGSDGAPLFNSPLSCFGLVGMGTAVPPTQPDRDGDGVPDSVDQCPDEPFGHEDDPDRPGCPPPEPEQDSDSDGVPDSSDQCPTIPTGPDPDPNRPGCPGSYP